MPWRNSTTPRQTSARAQRAGWSAAALATTVLSSWTVGLLPDSRIVLACYLTLVIAAATCCAVVLLARCHVATSAAFSAGFQAGQHMHTPLDPTRRAQARRAAQADGRPTISLVK